MSKVCILITSEYPYKTQETFLEDEIRFLGAAFDKVFIFSLDILKEEKKRSLPDNVQSFPIGRIDRTSRFRLPAYALNGMIHPDFYHEKAGSAKKYLMKTYISGKSLSEASIILKHLKSLINPGDSLCLYSYWFFNHAMIACRLKKKLAEQGYQVKAFSRGHRYDIYSERNSLNYIPFQRSMIPDLNGIYICSQDGCDYITRKYGENLCRNKVHVGRLGTLEHGTSMQTDFSYLHFVTCSRLAELKRVQLFAKAFVLFHQEVQNIQSGNKESDSQLLKTVSPENIRWTCMGSGEEYDIIKKIIDDAGLTAQVQMPGNVAHDNVMEFYHSNPVTFFFNMSTSEGVPVSIMEAQSFGIPAIATDVGGTAEIVNAENGYLLDEDLTPESLCTVMLSECREDNIRRKQKSSRLQWEQNSYADELYSTWCQFLADSIKTVNHS